MTIKAAQCVGEVFADVVENMAFMFATPLEKSELPEAAGGIPCAFIEYRGHANGSLMLAGPGDWCRELAANVLGVDEEDDLADRRAQDALKELLNVTCGQLLTALHGDGPVFDLTPPQIKGLDAGRWREMAADPRSFLFDVDGHPVLLMMTEEA